ncbi:poly polymerase and DNA-ligase Zn-finger region family protein (macronuclear) [Tetrahymena thermophila SB210]|uniref:Poly polymerase and DNA-ligase Zn-finger region family protein n=1 Tax=Tetrahymena thermophila (strain SB210) TaxID=312017 RepID=I7LZH7_TETTS|nr:poly polymerase and DNA-ligase Zn-finger region family protein [Tetrahymena thermophila SB210]EAR83955.1 poly polymerase and DNA-ligase Zn-finger region family protein [Tetrahymena thermophila SB210]|eukprot:XP_001031618.1 poly polymerase and DNA-ligase Zn-finger region family protein [Tetrahymena thermophila SB210]
MTTNFTNFYYDCFCAELAKSGRSQCKACYNPIENDSLRIGYKIYVNEEHSVISTKWYHPKCVVLPEKFTNLKVWDIEGIDDLESKYHKEIKESLKIQQGKKDQRVQHLPKITIRECKPTSKFNQQKTFDKQQWNKFVSYKEEFNNMDYKQLKQLLIKNDSCTFGGKKLLAKRCAILKMIGVVKHCPTCGGNRIRFYFADGQYYCPGYLDDTNWVDCKQWFDVDEIKGYDWIE